MGKMFVLAAAGVVALGVGATVIVYLGTVPPRRPALSAAVAPPLQAAAPAPAATLPEAPQRTALPPPPPTSSAPVRAAPVNAPEQPPGVESGAPDEQGEGEEERRDHRRSRPRRR